MDKFRKVFARVVLILSPLVFVSASSVGPFALSSPVYAAVQAAVTFTVNSTADPGDGVCDAAQCTLREAINTANATPGTDTIAFNIPTSDPGYMTSPPTWWRIQPTSALPTITDPVVIDGYTQPGASPNTNSVESRLGLNGSLKIEIAGGKAGLDTNGLHITAGNSLIRGLVVNRFRRADFSLRGHGILIEANGQNIIAGNYVGPDITGTVAFSNTFEPANATSGITIWASNDNVIGGTTPESRNLVSGNDFGIGVSAGYGPTAGNSILGNLVGTDATGNSAVGNIYVGVAVAAPETAVGGAAPGAGNVVAGNGSNGIQIAGPNTVAVVKGNFVGTNAGGTVALPNGGVGVGIFNGARAVIGGTVATERNLISGNISSGVFVATSSTGNAILGNSIFSNGGLGIDLGAPGVTPNDVGDADTGANNLQNFPVLTSAVSVGGATTVRGSLSSTPSTEFRMEFFANATCDPSGYGQGEAFLVFFQMITFGTGTVGFNVDFGASIAAGHFITATATDLAGNTSEFSACQVVAAEPSPTPIPTLTPTPTPMGSTLPSPTATPIPGLMGWGLIVTAALLAALTYLTLRRRSVPG